MRPISVIIVIFEQIMLMFLKIIIQDEDLMHSKPD
jgi:hypothetical protein